MTDSSQPNDWDDITLTHVIQQAQQGNSQAQNELFGQIQAYLTFVATKHFHATNKMGVSDIVQQSMIQAVENVNAFRGNSYEEFKGWLRQIVVNEARQTQRKFTADKRDVARERPAQSPSGQFNLQADFADSLPTPGTDLAANEEAERIQQVLSTLPEDYQQVIQLRNWEKLQFGDIAERMNLSVSGAAKLWYRALAALKKNFEQNDE